MSVLAYPRDPVTREVRDETHQQAAAGIGHPPIGVLRIEHDGTGAGQAPDLR